MSGGVKLAKQLREHRNRRGFSQEELAERAGVAVETVRSLERERNPRQLPRRAPPRGAYALDLICATLGVDLEHLLCECYTRDELAMSHYAWVLATTRKARSVPSPALSELRLDELVQKLPSDGQALLDLSTILQLRNAGAFAYIFALESAFPAFEMAVLKYLPVIFLDQRDIDSWISKMGLSVEDGSTFVHMVAQYKKHFRALALEGGKRYKLVVSKRTFFDDILSKESSAALRVIDDLMNVLRSAPRFDLVLLDTTDHLVEYEVLSKHAIIPNSLDGTVSLMIRQTRTEAGMSEYSLVPMPPSYSALQADISRIDHYWALALDQYRAGALGDGYWMNPTLGTIELLGRLKSGIR